MKIYSAKEADLLALCQRKAVSLEAIVPAVKDVLTQVKASGDSAVQKFTARFDGIDTSIRPISVADAGGTLGAEVKTAFSAAAANISKFHQAQNTDRRAVETMPGVNCFTEMRPIEKVGLYIPGGTAPLPSTVLMLAIPALLAGCSEIVLVTPPTKQGGVADSIAYAAQLCGISQIYPIGGAQAVAAMAYGTETVPKVDKIFGPGNQYVMAAKMLVSIDPQGAAIDMPAGPSEVMVIADQNARADFVAADLLSQAEHGPDSVGIAVCTDITQANRIVEEVGKQCAALPRAAIAEQALEHSFVLVVDSINDAIAFSNSYAPEHLIVNVEDAANWVPAITNAGSVFLGPYSCESAGDYASGTNHVLPTSGYARAYGGVSLASFQKHITFQQVDEQGAKTIGPIVSALAEQEMLTAHQRAMELRYE
ncbi:MAG: histidinol dehydrogenase [Corynebacteriales bacterium]|nr:histidinol dehydrogenase [Mycobacteriales bacterium]